MEQRQHDISELKRLSVAERILIVEELWDSIAAEHEKLQLTDEQRNELDRRIADYDSSPDEGHSWGEVKEIVRNSK
jgi:putative addiction module component (TIGR02574 family)